MSMEICGVESCSATKREHGQRWTKEVGWHMWQEPTKEQIRQRLRKRYGIV